MAVHATAEGDDRARVERVVVIEPTPNDGVDLLCEVIESPGCVPVKPPRCCPAAHFAQLPRRESRKEACKGDSPSLVHCFPGPECRSAERERDMLVRSPASRLLAIYETGLLR